ncbi:MAG: efflux RND transporter periplasmic adaptor subunit [Bryobacteraceae bacterium]
MRISFVGIGVCAAGLLSCSGPYSNQQVAAKGSKPAAVVKVLDASRSNIPEIVTATGELLAEEQATVSAKVPGRVARLLVDLGSQVKAGDVVAELEKDDYEFRVKQADAAVQQIRARLGILDRPDDQVVPEKVSIVEEAAAALREARFIYDTTTKLQTDGVVSRIDFEKAQVRRQGAEAHYQSALAEVMTMRAQLSERRAQLALAKQQLEDTVIRAPFAGGITRRQASLGEYLAVNAPVVLLVRQHPLRVRLEVPERLAVKVKPGQQIDVALEGSNMTRAGRVVRLSPALEAQNRSLTIEGEIPNQDGKLRPGSFAEATITVNPAATGIALPFSAIISFAGIERCFLVKNGVLDERVLRTGRRLRDNMVEILQGVEPGDQVALDATDRFVKGMAVQVK